MDRSSRGLTQSSPHIRASIKMKHPSTITTQVLAHIASLYQVEASIRGSPADEWRQIRQTHAKPLAAVGSMELNYHIRSVAPN